MRTTQRYENARAYLGQVRKEEDQVRGMEMRLENLRMLATDTANHMTGTTVSGNSDKDKIGRIMAEIDEMEQKIEQAKEKAWKIREEVGDRICQISDPIVQKAIILHDMNGHTCEETAEIMHCGRSQVYRWRDTGYAELEGILEKSACNPQGLSPGR